MGPSFSSVLLMLSYTRLYAVKSLDSVLWRKKVCGPVLAVVFYLGMSLLFGLGVHFTYLLLGFGRFVRCLYLCFSLSRSMLCLMPNFRASVPQTGQFFPLSSFSVYGHI